MSTSSRSLYLNLRFADEKDEYEAETSIIRMKVDFQISTRAIGRFALRVITCRRATVIATFALMILLSKMKLSEIPCF